MGHCPAGSSRRQQDEESLEQGRLHRNGCSFPPGVKFRSRYGRHPPENPAVPRIPLLWVLNAKIAERRCSPMRRRQGKVERLRTALIRRSEKSMSGRYEINPTGHFPCCTREAAHWDALRS